VIESLRKSDSKLLAFSAACTFGIGCLLGMMVRLFHHGSTGLASGASRIVAAWGRASLEMNAAAAASRVASICMVLWLISDGVWALAYLSETDRGVVRFSARMLYVLSFIGVVAAISAAVFFLMLHL